MTSSPVWGVLPDLLCSVQVAAGVRFMGEGLAILSSPTDRLSNISLGFRSTQLAALLFAAETEVHFLVPSSPSTSCLHLPVQRMAVAGGELV